MSILRHIETTDTNTNFDFHMGAPMKLVENHYIGGIEYYVFWSNGTHYLAVETYGYDYKVFYHGHYGECLKMLRKIREKYEPW